MPARSTRACGRAAGSRRSPFADDAELHFANATAGPFVGLEEIRRAYREQSPDDEIVALGIQDEEDSVVAAFAWAREAP